jgi:hypothetical protein
MRFFNGFLVRAIDQATIPFPRAIFSAPGGVNFTGDRFGLSAARLKKPPA